jgi:hypothetical protein
MSFPSTYNFNYYRGDTFEFVVRPKINATGDAFDLENYDAAFTIATARGSGGTQFNASAVVNETSNIVTCKITPTLGRTIASGIYVYDIQISNGINIYTLLTGIATVTDDITGAL